VILIPDRRILLPSGRYRSAAWRRVRAGRAAFSLWDLGGCNCSGGGGGTCSQTFTVVGCSGLTYAGVTVSVYTLSGGSLLASGTTNGSGQVTLSWTGSGGTYWIAVTGQSARFATYGQSLNLTCGASTTLTLALATGYHCIPYQTCLLPLADTILGTISGVPGISAITLTFSGGINWQSGFYTDSNGNSWQWTYTGSSLVDICGNGAAQSSFSCPTSFSWAGTTSLPCYTVTTWSGTLSE
jgi:hypothetical protein